RDAGSRWRRLLSHPRARLRPVDPDNELAGTAAKADGIFTYDDARRGGLRDDQIEFRERFVWARPHHMVFRKAGAPETWRGNARAACRASEPFGVLGARSATYLYGLPGGRREFVELNCPRWRRPRVKGLIVHESTLVPPSDVTLVDEIP